MCLGPKSLLFDYNYKYNFISSALSTATLKLSNSEVKARTTTTAAKMTERRLNGQNRCARLPRARAFYILGHFLVVVCPDNDVKITKFEAMWRT